MAQEVRRPSAHESRSSSLISLMLGWAQQGVDSFLATQRILLEFAARKNASLMKSLREGVSDPDNAPAAILTELAVEATANFTEAQRILLNLAQEENNLVATGVKERVAAFPPAVALTDRLHRGFDTFVEMQQDFLTLASKHVQERLQPPKAGREKEVAGLVDIAREAMDNFVRAQKKFLEIVVQEGAKSKAGKEETGKKKTELSKLAREAADSFIEAQKKLLDLAGQQVNVNLQTASRAVDMATSYRPGLPIPNLLTTERVKNFVDAEKALVDSVMKPANGAKAESAVKTHPAARRPAPRRKESHAAAEPAQAGA
jgi:hypothetical protein